MKIIDAQMYRKYSENLVKHLDNEIHFQFSDQNKFGSAFYQSGRVIRALSAEDVQVAYDTYKDDKIKLRSYLYTEGFLLGTDKLQEVITTAEKGPSTLKKKAIERYRSYTKKYSIRDSLALFSLLLRIVLFGKEHKTYVTVTKDGNPEIHFDFDVDSFKNEFEAYIKLGKELDHYIAGILEGTLYTFLIIADANEVLKIKPHNTKSTKSKQILKSFKFEIVSRELEIPVKLYLLSTNLFSKHGTSFYSYNLDIDESIKQAGMLRGIEAVAKDCFGNDIVLEDINLGKAKVTFLRGKDLIFSYAYKKFKNDDMLKFLMQNLFFEIEQASIHSQFDIDGIKTLPLYLREKIGKQIDGASIRIYFSPFRPLRVIKGNPRDLTKKERIFFDNVISLMGSDSTLVEVLPLIYNKKIKLREETKQYFNNEEFTLNKICGICENLQNKRVLE